MASEPRGHRSSVDLTGVYELVAWHQDGARFAPPTVTGRFVLWGGTVTTILIDRRPDAALVSAALFGHYTLEGGVFAYAYTEASTIRQVGERTVRSEALPFSGARRFRMETHDGVVRLQGLEGSWSFEFDAAGFRYGEADAVQRVWRRVPAFRTA
jgi:hypothetical protein